MKNRTETLEIGSRAPDFSLGAANREGMFTLGGLLAQGALILEFLRGTWCPNCRKRMIHVESRQPGIEAAGAQLAFIAAEKRDGVWKPGKFLRKHPVSSVFLLDEDRAVTRAYGLHHRFGADAIDIAHPATLVIDRNDIDRNDNDGGGFVRYIYRGVNQFDRAPLDEVLGALVGH
ncbi:MAG: redoxin family protein [Terriglobales bacterium]|jgi:peroxiredoxin Q/BCP